VGDISHNESSDKADSDVDRQESPHHAGSSLVHHSSSSIDSTDCIYYIYVRALPLQLIPCIIGIETDTGIRSYARNFFVEPSVYGIGHPIPIRFFADALSSVGGGRDKLIFVNNGFVGGDIERVISKVSESAKSATAVKVEILTTENELRDVCRSSLRGVSTCIAAAVFYSSPQEGPYGIWNYSVRVDGALGERINVDRSNNDDEIYVLPFQHSIDKTIAGLNTTIDQAALPEEVWVFHPWVNVVADRII
jgi:hypothetical protein